MNLFNVTGQASANAELQKGIESIVFYTTKTFSQIQNEKISISVERNGGSNIEITQGFVPLKPFLLAATFGDDAMSFLPGSGSTSASSRMGCPCAARFPALLHWLQ